jgi:ribosomal protein S27AE
MSQGHQIVRRSVRRKPIFFAYCEKCGLVLLANHASRKALAAACPDDRDV